VAQYSQSLYFKGLVVVMLLMAPHIADTDPYFKDHPKFIHIHQTLVDRLRNEQFGSTLAVCISYSESDSIL
jgi:hypothetical protein